MKKLLILGFLLYSFSAFTQQASRTKHFNLHKGVAIDGYDPVAYFTQKKAVRGNKELAVTTDGITYWFSSEANKEAFKKEANKYEPQYGGWCAYAMGTNGEKVEIDPATFKILGGKLYLFYNKFFNNTLNSWNEAEANLKTKADANWAKTFK